MIFKSRFRHEHDFISFSASSTFWLHFNIHFNQLVIDKIMSQTSKYACYHYLSLWLHTSNMNVYNTSYHPLNWFTLCPILWTTMTSHKLCTFQPNRQCHVCCTWCCTSRIVLVSFCVQSHQNDAHAGSYMLLISSFYLCPLSRELSNNKAWSTWSIEKCEI